PDNLGGKEPFVILIKEGVYEEIVRIGLPKSNVVFLGEGIGKTVITGSLNFGLLGINTYNTATVGEPNIAYS
ncbi:probable pectinesterase/pectinesterase inhibitor 51, partial [Tanacetum coccineum]